MKFKTEISFKSSEFTIEPQNKLLFIGSCFSENIGSRFKDFYFKTEINPFGTIFNPVSIADLIVSSSQNSNNLISNLYEYNGDFKFLNAYSKFSSNSKNKLLEDIRYESNYLKSAISESDFIFITLGSSIIHRFLEKDLIVANCHKIPNKYFKVEQLELSQITESLIKIIDSIHILNNHAKIVFTVSPVRYLAYGFRENQISKSLLFASLHQVSKTHNFKYLPIYELFMDELRDYRFYHNDLIHPSDFAIDYVWEKIVHELMSDFGNMYIKEISSLNKLLAHRISNNDISKIEKHNVLIQKKKNELKIKYHFLEF